MNLSTIEQGEELLKKLPKYILDSRDDIPNSTDFRQAVAWLWNNASELLAMAKENEELKKKVAYLGECVDEMYHKYHKPKI